MPSIAVQMGESERQSNSLQSEIRELTLRLYAKEQDALRLEMCLGMHGCRPAMRPPCGLLPCTDVGPPPTLPHEEGHYVSWQSRLGRHHVACCANQESLPCVPCPVQCERNAARPASCVVFLPLRKLFAKIHPACVHPWMITQRCKLTGLLAADTV